MLPRVAARVGLLMRSRERREGTCSGMYLATCPTSPGERRGALAGSPPLSREPSSVLADVWWDFMWGRR